MRKPHDLNRRDFLKLMGISAATGGLPQSIFPQISPLAFAGDHPLGNKILVVLELSGGNDGLNTLVPYGNDAYYKNRPTLGIKPNKLRKIDDHFGFNPDMSGMEKLYK
ncbi:MAG: twin-arginine translocation signal domain-containing protein, partial [Burkholderiales bacterium]|nr:twin-arginine translocation signal domain-containing protein [Burkholderiales bacterium]